MDPKRKKRLEAGMREISKELKEPWNIITDKFKRDKKEAKTR